MSGASRRRLSSVLSTRDMHFRHMGLWIVLCVGLVVLLNLCFHLFIQERWGHLLLSGTPALGEYEMLRRSLLISQLIEIALFSAGIVALAMFTSHRIAGPFLRLRRAFNDVRDGNLDHRLVFRKYDHLDPVEQAFNEMMRALRDRCAGAGRGGGTRPGDQ